MTMFKGIRPLISLASASSRKFHIRQLRMSALNLNLTMYVQAVPSITATNISALRKISSVTLNFNFTRHFSEQKGDNITHEKSIPSVNKTTPAEPLQRVSSKSNKKELPKYDEKKGDLVYVAPLSPIIRKVKGFTLFTSTVALGLQPMLISKLAAESVGMTVATIGAMGFFIFLTPFLIHWTTLKYVTHLYYNQNTEKFHANTITIFLRDKEHVFTSDNVVVPHGVFGLFTTIKANGRPLFVDPRFFTSKSAFYKMMRYDEPVDYRMHKDK